MTETKPQTKKMYAIVNQLNGMIICANGRIGFYFQNKTQAVKNEIVRYKYPLMAERKALQFSGAKFIEYEF